MNRLRSILSTVWLASLAGLAGAGRAGATLVEIPARYQVEGASLATFSGPDCCSGYEFDGRFSASFEVSASGEMTFLELTEELSDLDVGGVGFLGLGTVPLRCAAARLTEPGIGWVDGAGGFTLPAGALRVAGQTFKRRDGDGVCQDLNFGFEADSTGSASGIHDPLGNLFRLHGSFAVTIEGDSYVLTVDLAGHYRNRPPVARLGLTVPGFEQGGCPAVFHPGNPSEWQVEANIAGGFKAPLRGFSSDPDGVFARSDLLSELWYYQQNAEPAVVLGSGSDLGTRFFPFGPQHRVTLVASDRAGAGGVDECVFRVVDTRPPAVAAPPPTTLACSQMWGASPGTSTALASWLASASASDLGDAAPVALPPILWGAEINATTPFWADIWTGGPIPVEFRFRDASGNLGSATSTVRIYDNQPPGMSGALSPAEVAPSPSVLVPVSASLTLWDDCSPVWVWLESIVSNAPAFDATDIVDASIGYDDRSFSLRARPAGPGVPRVYAVTYRAQDSYGNAKTFLTTFTVRAK